MDGNPSQTPPISSLVTKADVRVFINQSPATYQVSPPNFSISEF